MNILSLGEKIKKLRKEKNMTLKELAGDRITAAQISHIERDKSHTSYELLEYLAKKLDVSMDYLLETKEMQSKKLTDNLILQSEVLFKCNELEESKLQIKEALSVCKEYQLIDNYGKCNLLLGSINLKQDNASEAINSYEKALYFFIKNNDKYNMFECYLNIGKIYMKDNFYKGAILQFELAKEILESFEKETIEVSKNLYTKMAYCYNKLNNHNKSIEYIRKVEELKQQDNINDELELIILKAKNLFSSSRFDESKEWFKKALEILDAEQNKNQFACVYLTISELYDNMGNLPKALEYCQKVYDIKKNDNDEYTFKSLCKIIQYHINNEEYEIANKYCKLALAMSIKNKNMVNEYKILRIYSEMYKNKKEYNVAIEYLLKCIKIVDEVGDKKILGDLYIDLGEIYSNISKEKELEFYQKGVSLYRNLDIV